jgi:hypothetical protein
MNFLEEDPYFDEYMIYLPVKVKQKQKKRMP